MSHAEINTKLLSSRKELLDIGLRNPMLNFRPLKTTLTIVNVLSEDVLTLLYHQSRPMAFSSMSEQLLQQLGNQGEVEIEGDQPPTAQLPPKVDDGTGVDGASSSVDGAGIAGKAGRQPTARLHTAMTHEQLFERLLRIQTAADDFMQEQGVNSLFLALGFLHWFEDAGADKQRTAPLVLVPVQLTRGGSGTSDGFRLEYSGDDVGWNESLTSKLKQDFALDLPHYISDSSADAEELPPLDAFFSAVRACISGQPRWAVQPNEICLGFFSFGKYLMYRDLDPATWPPDKQPADHPVLGRLLGEEASNEAPAFEDSMHIDTALAQSEVHFVTDADSSQTRAILEASAGRNLVIQGPPGTGKSQTITNIIAQCLGQGKTVLFVAEKMAALEVVKRRLDIAHLGDAVLELHSHKATKSVLLKELGRTLEQGKPQTDDGTAELTTLSHVRDRLNQHSAAVNAAVGGSGIPFIRALGQYLRLKREQPDPPVWSFTPMRQWSSETYTRQRQRVIDMARQLDSMGCPANNLFWGTTRTSFSPPDADHVRSLLNQAMAHGQYLASASAPLAEQLGFLKPVTLEDVQVICRAAGRVIDAPPLTGIQLVTDDWQRQADPIRQLVAAGQRMTMLHAQYADVLIESAWEADLHLDRQYLVRYGEKWWRVCSAKYRGARARLQGLCTGPLSNDLPACLMLVDAILEFQHHKGVYDQWADVGAALFGTQWQHHASDWAALSRVSEWMIALYSDTARANLPIGMVDFLAGQPNVASLAESTTALEQHASALPMRLAEMLENLELRQHDPIADLLRLPLQELHERLRVWRDALDTLYAMTRFNLARADLEQAGLAEIAEHSGHWQRTGDDFVDTFDVTWYGGLVNLAYEERPQLRLFDRIKQESLVADFRDLDRASLRHTQTRLTTAIWQRMPDRHNQLGEMQTLRHEIHKKRRHMPIRQLLNSAGRAIQQIKPVFMMSPISIANFLPPGRIAFDVVVFDEASQIKVVDAFGAILRGRQVIVVGDSKQMPPTDFFSREVELDDEENTTSDIESILGMFRARGFQERFLNWHYRSRHESLIAVSNVEFYDRKLVVFPTSGTNLQATGLKLRYVSGTTYDRGGKRTNSEEARAVAEAVRAHAEARPNISLGVVAFSMAQREQIQLEIERLRRESPVFEHFMAHPHPTEPFFVKNLENVQGDERDVIFISIGYGRNASGQIAKSFGPVNREGGERRLNVLITRAKLAMEVFSNFRADELALDAAAKHGIRALKQFLNYAEKGTLEMPRETGRKADSPFEHEVLLALEKRGYDLEPQVGTAGYFIDIGVRDPAYPGRYVLAIECDGASYHSAPSARDRDRLRQSVLEGLGWRFHRIWSTDWFRSPDREIERAVAAIEAARHAIGRSEPIPAEVPSVPQAAIVRAPHADSPAAASNVTYRKAELGSHSIPVPELHTEDPRRLAYAIKAVVAAEAPVHKDDVTRRLLKRYGVERAGNRISATIDQAIEAGAKAALFFYADGFVYTDERRTAQIRNRSILEPGERKIELVAPEELDAALLEVVRQGFSMRADTAIDSALELLGFGRVTKRMKEVAGARIDHLLAAHRLIQVDSILRCS